MSTQFLQSRQSIAFGLWVFITACFLLLGGCLTAFAQEDLPHRILLHYEAPQDKSLKRYRVLARDAAVFEGISRTISDVFVLPNDIDVYFTQCGEANAFYDSNEVEISVCYELMDDYAQIFSEENENEDELNTQILYATAFTFYHELGHALVDQFELPITGKEEDVVDEFAAILLLEAGDNGEYALLSEIQRFAALADEEQANLENLAFWDEHSLDSQRFYALACLLYGSNPEQYADLNDEDILPDDRAERCPTEYQKKRKSWDILLTPHTRDD